MRLVVILVIAAVIFGPFNVLTVRRITRLHPRRRRIVYALAVAGNLVWPLIPYLDIRNGFTRLARAILGPPWFAWTSVAVFYSMMTAIALLLWLPFIKRVSFDDFSRPLSRAFLWFILTGSVIGFYQALVPLRVEHVALELANLPPGAEGKKLALLSDLHTGLFTRPSRLEKIFTTTVAEKPDAILLAGDLIDDDPYFTRKFLASTSVIPASIPILATLGNHEIYGAPLEHIAQLRGTRVHLLVNEGAQLGSLWIAGLSDYAAGQLRPALEPDLNAALHLEPAGTFPIVVAHQPRAFIDAKARALPLTLVGHTHGGQCGFRPLHWCLAGVFVKYHMGHYTEGASQLFVTTGAGYWLLPFRLGMSPEIVIIELRRAGSRPPSARS